MHCSVVSRLNVVVVGRSTTAPRTLGEEVDFPDMEVGRKCDRAGGSLVKAPGLRF